MEAIRQILVALDLGERADSVVEHAARLARSFGAELTLLHVAAPDPDFVGFEAGPDTVRGTRAKELREEHRGLQARAEALRSQGFAARALLLQGPTLETIVKEARRSGADLLVAGLERHGALYRLFVGSTAAELLRLAPCPLYLVPPPPETGA
jgi:nucleotide-binding universal stress UspA family protein